MMCAAGVKCFGRFFAMERLIFKQLRSFSRCQICSPSGSVRFSEHSTLSVSFEINVRNHRPLIVPCGQPSSSSHAVWSLCKWTATKKSTSFVLSSSLKKLPAKVTINIHCCRWV